MKPVLPNRRLKLLFLLALLVQGCDNRAETSPAVEEARMKDSPQAPQHRRLTTEQQLDMAQSDLANRLGVDRSEVTVVSSGPVTWRSSATGCPEPGKMYTEALVPGYLVTLRVGKTTYRYHARSGGQPFHCPDNRAESPTQDNVFE